MVCHRFLDWLSGIPVNWRDILLSGVYPSIGGVLGGLILSVLIELIALIYSKIKKG